MKKTLGQTMDKLCESIAWLALILVTVLMLGVGYVFAAEGSFVARPVSQSRVLGFNLVSRTLTDGFKEGVNVVRLACDVSCYITFGTSASGLTGTYVATAATGVWLNALTAEYFRVTQGQGVAVIRVNGAGAANLFIIEMTQ